MKLSILVQLFFSKSAIMLYTSGYLLMMTFFISENRQYSFLIFSYSDLKWFFSFMRSVMNSLMYFSPISFLNPCSLSSMDSDDDISSYFLSLCTTEVKDSSLSCRYLRRSTILFSNSHILSWQNCLSYSFICCSISRVALMFMYSLQYSFSLLVSSSSALSSSRPFSLPPMTLKRVCLLRVRFSCRSERQWSRFTRSRYRNYILFFWLSLAASSSSMLLTQLSRIIILKFITLSQHLRYNSIKRPYERILVSHCRVFITAVLQLMHRERSESTNRDKLSLRNLLNLQFQSNYRSTNIEVRPKTMYNQRQMKIFHEDRAKLMSEQKLHRNSSQQLARARPTSVVQSEDRLQKNKLKLALGKINVLADGSMQVDEQERIGSIYRFFQCLSKYIWLYQVRTQHFYQKAFTYIYESYSDIVYINRVEWPQEELNFLANLTKNEMLIRLNNGVKDITYKQLASELFKQMGKKLVDVEEYRGKCEAKFAELQEKIGEKNQIIKKLTGQVYFYEQHPSKEQFGYIAELEEKNAQLQQEIKKGKARIRELEDSIEYLTQYNNMLNERVEELRIKIYDYEIVQFSNLKEIEKNSDLKEFENNVELLKDLIQKGALRMASMREEYNKIDAYNQQLLGERSVLAKRAAVGFAQLTPRPNYKKIFTQYGLDYEKMLPEKVKPTTEQLVVSLIKRFKQFYNKHVKVDLKLDIADRESGRKGADPGEVLMQDIGRMSKQLRKVQNLSIEVKSGYSKQKQQQQQLNKRNKK